MSEALSVSASASYVKLSNPLELPRQTALPATAFPTADTLAAAQLPTITGYARASTGYIRASGRRAR